MTSASHGTRAEQQDLPRFKRTGRMQIAFVCIGNACRSQMAEGWVRHLAVEGVEAISAGMAPLGFIAPETIEVMEERNVSLDGQESKGLEAIDWKQVDVLINMTSIPGRSVVPGFQGRRVDWRVPDPFQRPLRTYRRVRDILERKARELMDDLRTESLERRSSRQGSQPDPKT